MREILFRAKRIDNRKWVYGWLTRICGRYYIHVETDAIAPEVHAVIPETIGQYAGMNDVNGEPIFEGDVVSLLRGLNHVVKWEDCGFAMEGTALQTRYLYRTAIIGNIHDAPEL